MSWITLSVGHFARKTIDIVASASSDNTSSEQDSMEGSTNGTVARGKETGASSSVLNMARSKDRETLKRSSAYDRGRTHGPRSIPTDTGPRGPRPCPTEASPLENSGPDVEMNGDASPVLTSEGTSGNDGGGDKLLTTNPPEAVEKSKPESPADSSDNKIPGGEGAILSTSGYTFYTCPKCGSGPWNRRVCQLCTAYDEVNLLENKLRNRKKEYASSYRSKIKQLEHELKALEQHYQREKAQWGFDNKLLKEKLQRNELEIGKLQRTELAKLHREDTLMDETARDGLRDSLHTKVQAISRQYFRKISWSESIKRYPNLNEMVPGVFQPSWAKVPWPLVRDSPDFSTYTLVDAVLYNTIAARLFRNPFFRAAENQALEEMLTNVFREGLERNSDVVAAWRKSTVDLLKVLCPGEINSTRDPPADGKSALQVLDKLSLEISALLDKILSLHDAVPVLDSSKRLLEKKIYDMVAASAKFAEDWHSRDLQFNVIDLSWIEKYGLEWGTERAAKYVTSFPKNKKYEENVKYTIAAVISPGFIRYEMGENEGTGIEIVWEKASVLLSKVEGSGADKPSL